MNRRTFLAAGITAALDVQTHEETERGSHLLRRISYAAEPAGLRARRYGNFGSSTVYSTSSARRNAIRSDTSGVVSLAGLVKEGDSDQAQFLAAYDRLFTASVRMVIEGQTPECLKNSPTGA